MNDPTFSSEKVEESIKKICLEDYNIPGVDAKIVGRTLGVHLPLKRLFTHDVQNLMLTGKVKDLESFLQLSDDAIDKIQNVIFTASRVVMSSERPLDFYIVKATDMDSTGLEFVMANHIQDVKEVRFWNIPLSEYYKRSYRDLRINRTLFFKRPVLELFRNVGKMNMIELLKRYFTSESSLKDISPFFYTIMMEYSLKKDVDIKVIEARSKVYTKDEVLVYAKVKETYLPKPAYTSHRFIYPSGTILEYIFVLTASQEGYKISRVLPFNYAAPDGTIKRIEFPGELKLYKNIETWPSSFDFEEIFLDEFLAGQMTQRTQALFAQDPKVIEAFDETKANFTYMPPYRVKQAAPPVSKLTEGKQRFFTAHILLKPKSAPTATSDILQDPQVMYVLEQVLREFAAVVHGYSFKDYDFLKLEVQGAGDAAVFEIASPLIEQFYKKRISLQGLLKPLKA